MRYISLFSGIGGLESAKENPLMLCEKDPNCIKYLKSKYRNSDHVADVKILSVPSKKLPKVDIVTGGWPCQDLSVAGDMKGFNGKKSVLFYDLLQVAINSKSESIIAENVPNLLTIDKGLVFATVLKELSNAGYKNISWRIINSREFNLPHQRRRLFIVASKSEQISRNLFKEIKIKIFEPKEKLNVYSFYHTAGTHSICFSENYVPTLKVSGSGAAIFYKDIVRKITGDEALRLQGFNAKEFKGFMESHKYAMAGNAVSKPIGKFIFKSISSDTRNLELKNIQNAIDLFGDSVPLRNRVENGIYIDGNIYEVLMPEKKLCSSLADFIDFNNNSYMSKTAILGLLRRSFKASKPIDLNLLNTMIDIVSEKSLIKEIGKKGIGELLQQNLKNEIYNDEEIEEGFNF
tara:strand:- start:826 stop:2040 length:1215 start_codon:yes stop_codon:yes gene_type:complete